MREEQGLSIYTKDCPDGSRKDGHFCPSTYVLIWCLQAGNSNSGKNPIRQIAEKTLLVSNQGSRVIPLEVQLTQKLKLLEANVLRNHYFMMHVTVELHGFLNFPPGGTK